MRKPTWKRLLSSFLAVILLVGILPTGIVTAAEDTNMVVKAELQGTGLKELRKWADNLATNTDYTLSLRVRGSGGFWLGAKGGDWAALASRDVTVTTNWSEVTLDFNTGSNTGINISVQDQVAAGTAYIDDVKITKKDDGSVVFTEDFETETYWTYGDVFSRVEEPAFSGGETPETPANPRVTTTEETDNTKNASNVHSGSYAMQLVLNSSLYAGSSVAGMVPGKTYVFSVWVKGTGSARFEFKQGSQDNIIYGEPTVITGNPNKWIQYTMEWTAPDAFTGNTTIDPMFYSQQGSTGTLLFDDMWFSEKDSDTNLLLNAGFESGSFEGWWGNGNNWGVPSNYTVVAKEATPGTEEPGEPDNGLNVHTGQWSMKLTTSGDGNWPYAVQWINVTPNTEYTIEMWVKGTGGFTNKITQDWNPVKTVGVEATATWSKVSYTWNSGSQTSCGFFFYDDQAAGSELYIDDVFFGVAGGTNLLSNSGFENGSLGSWQGEHKGAFTIYNDNMAAPVISNPEGLGNLGIYVWDRNPLGAKDFGDWIGIDPYCAEDFFTYNNWDEVAGQGRIEAWRDAEDQFLMMWSLPPFPSNGNYSLAEAATGAYNDYYKQAAQNLINAGMEDAIIRYGHEFNGSWYIWTATGGKEADYAGAFRQCVEAMRSVEGANFQFCWNPTVNQWGCDLAACYPGDAYVDVIGIDVYDQSWGNFRDGTRIYGPEYLTCSDAERLERQQAAWQGILRGNWGLQDIDDFADLHNKPVGLCEWGIAARGNSDGGGGNDNPYFIEQMYNWINTNNVAWHVYFNVSAGDGDHDLYDTVNFPLSSAKFQQLWNPNGATTVVPAIDPSDIDGLPEKFIKIEAEDSFYNGSSIGLHGDPWASNGKFVWFWKSVNCMEYTNVNAADGLTIVYQGWQSDLHASIYVNDIKVRDHVLFQANSRGWKDAYGYVTLNDLMIPEGANVKIQLDPSDEDNNWDNLKIDYILLHNAEGTYSNSGTPTGPVGVVETPSPSGQNPVHSGTHALRLQQFGDQGLIYNNHWFQLEPNTDYVLGMWVKGTGEVTVQVRDWAADTFVLEEAVSATEDWSYVEFTFNSGDKQHWVAVMLQDKQSGADGSTTMYIDDMSLLKSGSTDALVGNPGFEDGGNEWSWNENKDDHFTVVEGTPSDSGNPGTPDIPENSTVIPYRTSFTYSGIYSLVGAITGDGSNGGPSLNTKPTLKAGKTYVYSAWVRGSGRMALVIQKAYGDWAEVFVQPANATDDWQQVIGVFTPEEDGQYNIKVGMRDDSGNAGLVFVDDVRLVSADGDVIVDSNFENGGSDWWIGEGFTCVDHSVSKAENTHSGSWVMQISPTAETQWTEARINPDVPLVADATYHFSVWVKGNAEFAVQLTDTATWSNTSYNTFTTTSGEWEQITFDFTPSQTCGYMMKLINRSADGILYLDDLLMYTDGGNNLITNCDFELGDRNWNDRNAIFTIVNYSEINLSGGFIDDLNDLNEWIFASENVILDSSSTGSYGGDTFRVIRENADSEGSILYRLTDEDVNSFSIYVYNDLNAGAADILVYVSEDGVTYTPVTLTKDTYANAIAKSMPLEVYEAYGIPAGMKYLKIVLPANDNVKASEISKVVVNANTAPVTAIPGSGSVSSGDQVVLTTTEVGATILYTIAGQSGTYSYTAPITLEGSMDITVWAVKDGKLDSIKRTYSYLDKSEIIVDKYGQIIDADFTGKIHDDDELDAAANTDATYWDSLSAPSGRDIYGGLAGSKDTYGFTATGYFHIEKLDGKSVMVDPLGNLYFHQGANGTGYIDETYTQVAGREHIYEWLPERDDPTYAAAWMGSDNFSFYVANMIRKNGSFSQEAFSLLSDERMKLLGFTGAGAWSHSALPSYAWLPMPNITIPGTGLYDIFNPEMLAQMDANFASLAGNKDDPNIVAYLFGNELLYTDLKAKVPAANGADCGSKAKLVEMLQAKYTDIAAFNEAWNTSHADWDSVLTGSLSVTTESAVQDMDAFTQVYLDELYKQVAYYTKKYDPNHMVGGDRWLGNVMNDSKLRGYLSEAAGRYMDVLTYNYYTYDLNLNMIAELYEKSGGTPFIFTEFHYGDPTTGLTFGARMAENEVEKGLMYRNYVEKAAASGMIVGTNWFVYLDQAPTGRYFQGLSGEAGAIGLINVADRPYQAFLESVMEANYGLYDLILGEKEPYQYAFSPAQSGREDNKVLEVEKVTDEIVIGQFSDWNTEAVLLSDRDLVLGIMKQGLGAQMKVLWDEEYYYFQAHISDPTPMLNKDAHPEGYASWIWDGDAIELFFGPDDVTEGGTMKLRDNQVLLAAVMGEDGNVYTKYYWNGYYSNIGEQPYIDVAAKLDEDGLGYMIEARIKLSDIGVTDVGDGTMIRYDMGFDDGTMKGRDRQFFWNGVDGNSSNREKWGMMKLVEAGSEPGTDPSEPGTDPSVPGTDPSEPGTDPSVPGTDPSVPGTDPSEPGTDPSAPGTDPSVPGTDPSVPGTDPSVPGTDPSVPAADDPVQDEIPSTGDSLLIGMCVTLLLLSCAAMALVCYGQQARRKRSQ